MSKELQAGDKIEYCIIDAKGKEKWRSGKIHGVRTYEETSGIITKLTYLIDVGIEHPDHEGRIDPQPLQIELPPEQVRRRGK